MTHGFMILSLQSFGSVVSGSEVRQNTTEESVCWGKTAHLLVDEKQRDGERHLRDDVPFWGSRQ